ncbi:MAG: GGDEF domain-containing protein, partial [Gammaproteobacteria bacterium]|nr:GGDEF domain-containing protein [Gammaproteobacteria bacterium]
MRSGATPNARKGWRPGATGLNPPATWRHRPRHRQSRPADAPLSASRDRIGPDLPFLPGRCGASLTGSPVRPHPVPGSRPWNIARSPKHEGGRLTRKPARSRRRPDGTSRGMRCLLDARYVRELELKLRRIQRLAAANRRLALTDRLTGLPNRRHLELHLDRVLAHGALRPLSLVLFDVDGFKRFNDRHGYPAGDRGLAAVGTVFSRASANSSRQLESHGSPARPESGHR